MRKFKDLMLDVWREVSQHLEIGQSISAIARLLERELPLKQLCLRQLLEQECCLIDLAQWRVGNDAPPPARTTLTHTQVNRILKWRQDSKAIVHAPGERLHPLLRLTAPEHASSAAAMLASAFTTSQHEHGVLIAVAKPKARFTQKHAQFFQMLSRAVLAAIENDSRLRELEQLRKAAEADRQSLLRRLGRDELAEDAIVGANTGLQEAMRRVELVAQSGAPALILGESGSGKELAARAIHRRSARCDGPFVRVNCGAIPPELIDSQLFGHEKGAFTGAVDQRQGWFERADGGTLFLDEIGDLPLAAQVRLLLVLQDGWLERVGGHKPIQVDVRIVAATHSDLPAMVGEGKFREDLWYRIAVFPIILPPLRERKDDVPELARHFARRAARRFGLRPVMPAEDDIQLLRQYDWPGNVREFSAVIDRAAILGDGVRLEIAKALGMSPRKLNEAAVEMASSIDAQIPATLTQSFPSLEQATREHIERALQLTNGRVEGFFGAARLLRVNPNTLRSKMRKLSLDRTAYAQT
ncbi:sigma-54-dependent Fis family transcriptional regulator [Candidatus Sumerlaeota bacterium]|nr:sigma-54-dependent Fis family transcriptional regulator [Candidatus Sumerlaeota bacterium]